jgi:hypothetical protein
MISDTLDYFRRGEMNKTAERFMYEALAALDDETLEAACRRLFHNPPKWRLTLEDVERAAAAVRGRRFAERLDLCRRRPPERCPICGGGLDRRGRCLKDHGIFTLDEEAARWGFERWDGAPDGGEGLLAGFIRMTAAKKGKG